LDLPPYRHRAALDCRASVRADAMIALEDLNALPPSDFVATLGGIFEHSAWVAQRIEALRPFSSRLQLLDAMRAAVHAAPLAEQLALIRAHPKLGARGRNRSDLTAASAGEQRRAGLDACTDEEFLRLQRLNDDYSEKFSFPFILAVRGHEPASIIESVEARLGNDLAHERRTALREIGLIAEYRLADAVSTPAGAEIVAMRGRLVRCHVAPTDVGSARVALVREWMLVAGIDVSADAGGNLLGRSPGGALESRSVVVGGHEETNAAALHYADPMGCLLGIAVIQQFRQNGVCAPCELRIVASAAGLAHCAEETRDQRSLELAARMLANFLLQQGPTTGPTASVSPP
jgi:beta-ureidopropionase / N-carbamoyl-L-amino-acid hydrolase